MDKHDIFRDLDDEVSRIAEDIMHDLSDDAPPPTHLWYPQEHPALAQMRTETMAAPAEHTAGRWLFALFILAVALVVGFGALGFGAGAAWARFARPLVEIEAPPPPVHTVEAAPHQGVAVENLADIVELLEPAVVGITTRRGFDAPAHLPSRSLGSGFVISEDETRVFIATGFYVVRGGTSWEISFGDATVQAHPIGRDPNADLAVVGVYKHDLAAAGVETVTIAPFGDANAMRVGDVVLAIGNAMGDGNSVTRGVISAPITEVFIPGRARALPVFQTDAAINYGMGGGLLVNARSEVIGINLAYTHRGGLSGFGVPLAEGMSYSISINEVAPLLIQMIEDLRRPPRPAIGIMGRTISEGIAEMLGVPPLGVHVSRAIEGGAAYDAGVLADDIITGMDDMPIFNMEQLQAAIAALSVGDTVELNILRDGEIVTLRMTLGEMVINFDVQ